MRQIPNLFRSLSSPTHPLFKKFNRYFWRHQYHPTFTQNHQWLGDTQIAHPRILFSAPSLSILTVKTAKLPHRDTSEGKCHTAAITATTKCTNYRWHFPESKSVASKLKKKKKYEVYIIYTEIGIGSRNKKQLLEYMIPLHSLCAKPVESISRVCVCGFQRLLLRKKWNKHKEDFLWKII